MLRRKSILLSSDEEATQNTLLKLCDLYDRAEITGKTFYSKFLTPLEASIVQKRFPKDSVSISFFGGFEEAERVLVAFSQTEEQIIFPLTAIQIKAKSKETFSHRDYLGSVLSLGIKRELTGDIIIREEDAILFCITEIADFLQMNLNKVKNSGVRLAVLDDLSKLNVQKSFTKSSQTVSSMRADCVISAATGKSRTTVADWISHGIVTLNYEQLKNNSVKINNGDILSVKKIGKYRIESNLTLTKKGRISISIYQYI